MSPGDQILTVFNWYPYTVPQAIVIDPEKSNTYITIDLYAEEESWTMDNPLQSKKSFFVITF